ncbi:hypothetical protein D3C75_377030 [compost metagenome]
MMTIQNQSSVPKAYLEFDALVIKKAPFGALITFLDQDSFARFIATSGSAELPKKCFRNS